MPAQADRIEFAPPPQSGMARAFGLALVAHGLLIIALTVGLQWKREAENVAVEAELWSSVPREAAPRPVETPPPPPPPTAKVEQAAPTPQPKEADIAIERERKQRELEKERREQQRELEKKRQAEKDARDRKAAEEKKVADKRKQDEARREEQQAKAAEEKRRQDNIRRMQGMAGASGSPDATGSALQSAGPSASYGARLAALFKRNISFPNPDSISGNPKATVEVRVSPSGLIIGSKLTRSSGVPAWDEAVLRAVEKTERIPADENGRFVTQFPVNFGPKD